MIDNWPLDPKSVKRIGQGVMSDRGNGKPHKGVDIYADSGTDIISPVYGRVLRVIDGRDSNDDSKRAAGLWIDIIQNGTSRVHRFLHLGSSVVSDGKSVKPGALLGKIAQENTSGLGESGPHVHYEIRSSDFKAGSYGEPIEPKIELADVVARNAWSKIPAIAHVVGIELYGDPRYIKISKAVLPVWKESDPDKRLELAGKAYDVAVLESSRGYVSAAKEALGEAFEQRAKDTKEVLKEAGKEVASGVGEFWSGIGTGWKIAIVSGAVGLAVIATKKVIE